MVIDPKSKNSTEGFSKRKPSGFNFLGSLSELGTGLLSFGLNAAYNSHQAEKNREWQEAMWQKQVAYNHPLQQRARLLAAGINPYSGLDSVPAGSVGPGAVASPANANLSAPLDASMKMASIAELLSRSEVNDAETGKKTAELAELLIGVELGLINLEDARRMFEDKWESYEEAGTSPTKQSIRESTARARADEASASASEYSIERDAEYLRLEQELLPYRIQLLEAQSEEARNSALRDLREAAAVKWRLMFDRNADNRAQSLHRFQVQAARYASQLGASEAELAKISEHIANIWFDEDRGDFWNGLLNFIHSNVRLAGSASYSRK